MRSCKIFTFKSLVAFAACFAFAWILAFSSLETVWLAGADEGGGVAAGADEGGGVDWRDEAGCTMREPGSLLTVMASCKCM